tara:strand:+ start:197 stop:616 length:420 start_codon:yes stop_codon:yes gene_type:complete
MFVPFKISRESVNNNCNSNSNSNSNSRFLTPLRINNLNNNDELKSILSTLNNKMDKKLCEKDLPDTENLDNIEKKMKMQELVIKMLIVKVKENEEYIKQANEKIESLLLKKNRKVRSYKTLKFRKIKGGKKKSKSKNKK